MIDLNEIVNNLILIRFARSETMLLKSRTILTSSTCTTSPFIRSR